MRIMPLWQYFTLRGIEMAGGSVNVNDALFRHRAAGVFVSDPTGYDQITVDEAISRVGVLVSNGWATLHADVAGLTNRGRVALEVAAND